MYDRFEIDQSRYGGSASNNEASEEIGQQVDIIPGWDSQRRAAYRTRVGLEYDEYGWGVKPEIKATGVAETFHLGEPEQFGDLKVRGGRGGKLEGPIQVRVILGEGDSAPSFLASGGDAYDRLLRAQELYNRGKSIEEIITKFGN